MTAADGKDAPGLPERITLADALKMATTIKKEIASSSLTTSSQNAWLILKAL